MFQSSDELIIGTWVPDQDGYDYRWVFKENGTIDKYDEGKVWVTYRYEINKKSSCLTPLNEGVNLYLKMTEKSESSTLPGSKIELCYELDGVTDEHLSLIYITGANYRPILFERF
ncbi:hypothetical protein [Ekhidna sp.]